MVPRVGLTGVARTEAGITRTGVNGAYVRSTLNAGGLPLILTPLIGAAAAPRALDACDALVLTGGEDLDPATYGEGRSPFLGAVDPDRDAFELAIFREALDRGMPVLAICRGLQLVNVAMGGTLWQDLTSQKPGVVVHDPDTSRDTRSHRIDLVPGTRTAEALGVTSLTANSIHHQGIKVLGSGLMASGTSEDGLIEAVELESRRSWLVGVQWHPEEFHREHAAPDKALFRSLIEEARKFDATRLSEAGTALARSPH
jgi:putative glutamine amidotransferase